MKQRSPKKTRFSALLRDLLPLLAVHSALLLCTLLASICRVFPIETPLGDSLIGDFKIQVVWMLFLIPGWLIGASWTGRRAGFLRRYFAAIVSSIAVHAVLTVIGTMTGMGMTSYFLALAMVTVAQAIIQTRPSKRTLSSIVVRRISWADTILIASVIVFSVAAYRTPRSSDIWQFVLQQQDMTAARDLQVSPIGMTSLGVDEPMPRWRSHLWHLLPCLISVASDVPVDQILLRYGTIPIAMSVLLCLWFVVTELSRTRQVSWVSLIAILGPVLLWYRSYNAFRYSFRLTNNFWLDKDFCLFFLIPAIAYLASGWLRGAKHYAVPLCMLVPAIVKFHPMTIVYLILLLPVVAVWKTPRCPSGFRRLSILAIGALVLFIAVLWIGDAQSYHPQIREIIAMDFADNQRSTKSGDVGRPLHYWSGFYGAIENSGLHLDTTEWTSGVFHLKSSVITGCGLLLVAHLCWLLSAGLVWLADRSTRSIRRWLALTLTLMTLWGIYFGSRFVLTSAPHLSGGIERLHWFAYLPCAVGVASTLSLLVDWVSPVRLKSHIRLFGTLATTFLLLASSGYYATGNSTPWTRLRGVNGLLDFELPENAKRQRFLATKTLDQDLKTTRPPFLRDDDIVLHLEPPHKDRYWSIKQGVFWSDPYAEAFAYHERGEEFLYDRKHFYALVDQTPLPSTATWLSQRRVTLLIDHRDEAEESLQSVFQHIGRPVLEIAPGVWRIDQALFAK